VRVTARRETETASNATHLTSRARRLRRDSTIPERVFWGRLRAGRLGALKWRRQYVIGAYVVDFYCARVGLAIEVDGVTHVGREEKDAERTRYLRQRGLKVSRVTDDDVLRNLDSVAASVAVAAGTDL